MLGNDRVKESDDGPFYLSENDRIKRKYDTLKGETKILSKTKKELKDELKKKGYHVRGHCTKEKLEDLAKEYNVELTSEVELVEEGWVNRPKGLLQVLWERGWIDETKLSEYTLKGKANQMDGDQNILPEYRRFVLRHLMSQCADFKEEKSAMEVLLEDLSKKSLNNQKVELLVSPKYHCELAGEGVEYAWAVMKKYYRRKALEEKNTKKKFEKVVREAVQSVKQSSVELFAARCRRYMIAYLKLDEGGGELTYKLIERFVKVSKTHRNIGDQEKGFIQKAILDSISL